MKSFLIRATRQYRFSISEIVAIVVAESESIAMKNFLNSDHGNEFDPLVLVEEERWRFKILIGEIDTSKESVEIISYE